MLDTSFTEPVPIWCFNCFFSVDTFDTLETFDTEPKFELLFTAFGGRLNGKFVRFVFEILRIGVGGGGGFMFGGRGGATVGRPLFEREREKCVALKMMKFF